MDKKLKAKWIKALTSGKYKQGQNYLKYVEDNKAKHCCLGVLCEVAEIEETGEHSDKWFDGNNALLTPRLLKKFDLTNAQQGALTSMNDGESIEFEGKTINPRSRYMKFTTIAKWIAKNL